MEQASHGFDHVRHVDRGQQALTNPRRSFGSRQPHTTMWPGKFLKRTF